DPDNSWSFKLAWSQWVGIQSNSGLLVFANQDLVVPLSMSTNSDGSITIAQLILGILFVCAMQGLQTMVVHCAELVVNISRDEDAWRQLDASRKHSVKHNVLKTPALLSALFSWKYCILFIFKSTLHWLLGQSLNPSNSIDTLVFYMNYSRLLVYALCVIAFKAFITFLAAYKPKGPQPATWGHIQTLADLIDDWEMDKKRQFWWGDKGKAQSGVRHAGMCARKEAMGQVKMGALYA